MLIPEVWPSREDRERLLAQRGGVVWLTGFSGAGKSTLARALQQALHTEGRLAQVLDGDLVRNGLCSDLDFSPASRSENIRRVAEVAALLVDTGVIVLAAFVSPYRADRARARDTVGSDRFVEVFVDAPLAACEARDPKGLYQKARKGQLRGFTGIDAPYEPPESPDLTLRTAEQSVETCVVLLLDLLRQRQFLGRRVAGDRSA